MAERSRQVQLVRRPAGAVTPEHFTVVDVELPELRAGDVLVENIVLSVDPYMRPRMDDAPSYVPPYALREPLDGGAVGRVVRSADDTLPVGTTVLHMAGWRDRAVLRSGAVRPVDLRGLPPSYFLGVLGMPGLTAYAGLVDVAGLTPGETVFVSGAAGAVGSLVGQFARLLGAERVIGSAGTDDKIRHLQEIGFDQAFNYRSGPVQESLRRAAPDGIDLYFDNVGGDHFAAALETLRPFGRIAVCGTISSYESVGKTIPGNLFQIVAKRLRVQGFLVPDHERLSAEFVRTVSRWVEDGELAVRETHWDGVDSLPSAFIGLLRGENTGKVVVDLVPPDGTSARG